MRFHTQLRVLSVSSVFLPTPSRHQRSNFLLHIMELLKGKLENLAKQGVFGEGSFLRVLNASDSGKGSQFKSYLVFLHVDLVPSTGKITRVPVVVKTQVTNEKLREENGAYAQFMNEVIMYKNILPELGAKDLSFCPKMFHGEASNGENPGDDVVVMEDLIQQGYKVPDKVFLDCDHILLAMTKLGQLHGLSYKLKASSPERLVALGNMLIPRVFNDSHGNRTDFLDRGFKPLVDTSPSYSVVNKVYKKLKGFSAVEFMRSLQEPEEPFAVITHGDFNSNNLLYKYDESGKVVDMKMIDFGFSNYLDPVIDIAFFLYLNTSPEARKQHWDGYLNVYWDAVVSVAGDPGFSFSEFHQHFAERAIYAYLPCRFSLPLMLVGNVTREAWSDMNPEEMGEYFSTLGGKEGTSAVSAIVSHLLNEGYLDAYLRNLDNETPKVAQTPGYTNVTFNFA